MLLHLVWEEGSEEEFHPARCLSGGVEGRLHSAEAAVLALGRGDERGTSCGNALVLSPASTGIFMWAARGRFSAATQNLFFFLLALLINPVAGTQSIQCTQGLVAACAVLSLRFLSWDQA